MTIVILGIDLGKNSCSVVGLDESGAVVLRRRMRRRSTTAPLSSRPTTLQLFLPRSIPRITTVMVRSFSLQQAHPS